MERLERVGQPGRRHRNEDQVRALELAVASAERADLQPLRKLDAGEVLLVLALPLDRAGLLLGAAEKRGADVGALEQHGDGGAE